ncbi:hypothetical protein AB6O49_33665 [Streptomyces sp. SBR177]|uniref:hypothetical protein n=1 Tax=Streptomyces sp. NPDC046275 TaxID=3157201 RepID=UPI00340AEA01
MIEPHAASGIMYWRRSLWNGFRCRPVLLTLENGRFRATDRRGDVVFDLPVTAVTGRLSRLGTLLLTLDGSRYDLVGRGSSVSPRPSRGQVEALAAFRARTGSAGPRAGGAAGVVDLAFNDGAGAVARDWRDTLGAAGAALH